MLPFPSRRPENPSTPGLIQINAVSSPRHYVISVAKGSVMPLTFAHRLVCVPPVSVSENSHEGDSPGVCGRRSPEL
jgi:hypothetical protein